MYHGAPLPLSLLVIFLLSLLSYCASPTAETTPDIQSTPRKTIILAIDGGGIKGIIPATFLQAIEDSLNLPSYQLFDVIGGTSTGGIISIALVTPDLRSSNKRPFTATQIVSIYANDGDSIFVRQGRGISEAEYYAANSSNQGIEPYLQSLVGTSTTLSDSYRHVRSLDSVRVNQLFTTSYIINSSGDSTSQPKRYQDFGPYLFNWYDANRSPETDDYFVWEGARGTSAAPLYFPIAHVGGGGGFRSTAPEKWVIDGGTMANDPAVWGVSEALRTGIARRLDSIVVISLGTGFYPGGAGVGVTNEEGGDGNWGITSWGTDLYDLEKNKFEMGTALTEIILDAVQMVSDRQLQEFQKAGLEYYRLEPTLTIQQSQMDNIDPGNITSLQDSTKAYLSPQGAGYPILQDIIAALRAAR